MSRGIEEVFGGRYKVLGKLGKGGMGQVYLAETNDRLEHKRAIKEFSYNMTVGVDVLQEAFILKEFEHDGIPRIIEIQECPDIQKIYMVQEFIEGSTLTQMMEHDINESVIHEWAKELGSILEYIHARGVIHGDIKPDNIMVTKKGTLKLIDFGIASTKQGNKIQAYSKNYASPEQFSGKNIDQRSDIYSVGVVLCKLLSGKYPVYDSFNNDFSFMPDLDPELMMPGLVHITKMCLRINPEERYKSIDDYNNDMNRIHKLSRSYKRFVWIRDIQIGAVILLLIAGGILIMNARSQLSLEKEDAYSSFIEEAHEMLLDENFKGAQDELLKAEELFENRDDVAIVRCEALYLQGDYEGCIKLANDSFRRINEDLGSNLNYILGSAYFELDLYDEAIEYIGNAYNIDPSEEDFGRDLAVAAARGGSYDYCGELLLEMEENGYRKSITYYISGEYNRVLGNLEKAKDELLEAYEDVEEDELRDKIVMSIADLYKEMGTSDANNYVLLVVFLEEVLEDDQRNPILHEKLGEAYYNLGHSLNNESEAEIYFEKSLDEFEYLVDEGFERKYIYNNIVYNLQSLNRYDEVLVELEEMKERYSEDVNIQIQIVRLYLVIEGAKDIDIRDYTTALEAFNIIGKDYSDYEDSQEFNQLKALMLELSDNNWFERVQIKI